MPSRSECAGASSAASKCSTRRRRFAFVLYPLSGGYSRRPLVPPALYRPLQVLESMLSPLAPLLAFRCFVVLERT